MPDYKTTSDEDIVRSVRQGDKDLYGEIISRYEAKLLRYAVYLIRDPHDAADAVQEAFIKAYVNLNGFDARLKFSSWLYRIAHNEAMNLMRKKQIKEPLTQANEMPADTDLEGELLRSETRDMVKKCLSGLPLLYREPLALFYLEDRTYEEISDILRIPMGTVATRINRGKGVMRKLCQTKKTR